MNTNLRTDASSAEPSGQVRRPYSTPVLTRYGAVRDITQGGTSGNSETPGNCQTSKTLPCPGASDARLKEDVVRIGDHPAGFGLYLFRYRPEHAREFGEGVQFGVMAQEVENFIPDAVSMHPSGFRQVDYGMLGIER